MDKKDFIFPGVILGFVIITALGLLITHSDTPQLIPNNVAATSTENAVAGTTTPTDVIAAPASGHIAPASHAPYAYYPYGTLTLSLNQAAMFKDGVSIRPLSVIEDSRCPADVQCIQAGTVKLSIKVNVGGVSKTETIQLGQSVTAGKDTITLHAVTPSRTTQGAPASSAYRFTFVVAHMQ